MLTRLTCGVLLLSRRAVDATASSAPALSLIVRAASPATDDAARRCWRRRQTWEFTARVAGRLARSRRRGYGRTTPQRLVRGLARGCSDSSCVARPSND